MNPFTRLTLIFVAGFCDTASFIHMHGVFTAHITGNIVLFAASLARGLQETDYLKIIAFPVFMIGVVFATSIYGKVVKDETNHKRLLLLMTSILILSALITNYFRFKTGSSDLGGVDVAVIVALVMAMAIQNTIHHFIPGPMTTVMTGTVMNATAMFTEKYLLRRTIYKKSASDSVTVNSLWRVFSFVIGCVIAAFLTMQIGLSAIIVPAIAMLLVLALERNELKII
jgi:uncharacterized membrane protein YoaK (UPF0700 family)